jgi:hypothetical protein
MAARASATTCAAEKAMRLKRRAGRRGREGAGAKCARALQPCGGQAICGRASVGTGARQAARCSWPSSSSSGQRRHVDPAPLLPALQRGLDQLHALGAFGQRPAVGRVFDHVADEGLPLDLEAVVVAGCRALPATGRRSSSSASRRVPHRARRGHARLRAAVLQAGHRRAVRAVDVEGDEVVAAHARGPAHVDLRDHRLALVALQLEGGVGGVVGGGG